ncbi:hypothetical protein ACFYQ5_09685 [Streptomyces sp. NPDC005794]|uniref:hypothetical protein n=1 Tax=Streptomyces sp. NPDC005794 TaxID=3364733 RepID=UPI0036AF8E36
MDYDFLRQILERGVGRPTVVEPEEWPDKHPAAVLGAVRSSKQINADPTMANLRD